MTGTDFGGEQSDSLLVGSVRLPKLRAGSKQVIDYTKLDRETHSKFTEIIKVPHSGEVLKARMCPSQQGLVASVTNTGAISLFQISDFVNSSNSAATFEAVGTLHGNKTETFSLNWNRQRSNLLCSGADDRFCVWDVEQERIGDKQQMLQFRKPHGDASVNDVKFSPVDPNLIVSSGSDGFFKVWDIRDCGYKSLLVCHASDNEVNCATFNNVNRNLVVAGGEESGMIGIWDLRMPSMVINDVQHHAKPVTSLEWHPTQEQMFVSGAEDGKVFIWDNSKCGEEQARKDYEDGPPEMLFPHVHHSSLIEDVCW